MKILVLSSSFPYPVDIGRKSVMSGFLAYFMEEHGADNVVYATVDVNADPRLAAFEVAVLPQAGTIPKAVSVFSNSMIRRRMPIQEALLCGAKVAVRKCVDRVRPDLLVVDTIRMMRGAEPFVGELSSVIYLDDLYSLRYERMLKFMKSSPARKMDAIGSFSRFLPEALLPALRMCQGPLLRFESDLLRHREIEAARKFGKALLINQEEARMLSAASQRTVNAVKMLHTTKRRSPRRFSGQPDFLFLGNLSVPANAIGLMALLEAMPEIIRSFPDLRINVVGRGATGEHRRCAADFPSNLRFLDFVDDLEELLASSAALLAPIVFGTGIKIKVLDALCHGLPVIGTTAAVDGFAPGRHFVTDDDIRQWGRHMRALRDPEINAAMSASAIACYDAEYSPAVVREQYRQLFKPSSGRADRGSLGGGWHGPTGTERRLSEQPASWVVDEAS